MSTIIVTSAPWLEISWKREFTDVRGALDWIQTLLDNGIDFQVTYKG